MRTENKREESAITEAVKDVRNEEYHYSTEYNMSTSSEKIVRKNLSSEKLLSRICRLKRPNMNNTLSEKIL